MSTGASVIAVKYDSGVLIAADKLGSYGSLARFRNIDRIFKATDKAVMAFGGDIADYQFIREVIEQKVREDRDFTETRKRQLDAGALHCWLNRVLYNRRSRFDPLWLDGVVAGFKGDELFLGFVDKIGFAYQDDIVCSGFGNYLITPLLRNEMEKCAKAGQPFNKEAAKKALTEGMKVLYYRDCRAYNKYMMADISAEGVSIEDNLDIKPLTNWQVAHHTGSFS